MQKRNFLSSLSTDTTGKLDVLGHDGHTLGVDGTQVGVLKETNQVSLGSLLQGHDGRALESQISLEVLGDLTNQTLEWQLADEELCALLVPTDLTESYGTRSVTMGLLHSSSSWGTLTSCLGGQLFPWGFATSGFTCGLLSTSHCVEYKVNFDNAASQKMRFYLCDFV
jgi:histone H3